MLLGSVTGRPPCDAHPNALPLPQYGNELNVQVLSEMKVLHTYMMEALRINPPLILLLRMVKAPFMAKDSKGNVSAGPARARGPRIVATLQKCQLLVTRRSSTSPRATSWPRRPRSRAPSSCCTRTRARTTPRAGRTRGGWRARLAPPGSPLPALCNRPSPLLSCRLEQEQVQYAFIGFGGGRHRCMGENFAFLQVKAIWSYLLRNFDMELVDPFPEPGEGPVAAPAAGFQAPRTVAADLSSPRPQTTRPWSSGPSRAASSTRGASWRCRGSRGPPRSAERARDGAAECWTSAKCATLSARCRRHRASGVSGAQRANSLAPAGTISPARFERR